jgi:hypothetical protein
VQYLWTVCLGRQDLQLRGGINELAVSKIHQQAKVVEEVSTQDWLWHVSDVKMSGVS